VSRLVLLAALALGIAVPSAGAGVGSTRLLVVRLTWGPPVASAEDVRAQIAEADVFFRRSSLGRATLAADVTPVVDRFTVPPTCFAGANEDTGLGALSLAARAAASGLGYDLMAYDRFVFVFPEPVCGHGGLGIGRDVLLASPAGLGFLGLVHELGHTFRLPHAGSADCATCAIREYGDRFSVMGQGATDFSAWEKAQLGWLDRVRRVTASGTYTVDPVDARSSGAQALLVHTRAGTLWLEHRLSPTPRVSIRLVKRPPGGGAVRPIYLAGGSSSATVKGLLRIRKVAGGLAVTRLDRRRTP
jgi:hypothetical protein